MNKEQRKTIYLETLSVVLKDSAYMTKNGLVILPKTIAGSKMYFDETHPVREENFNTVIKVINNDSLYTAEEMIGRGLNPAVLNMANQYMPGGGVLNGSGAQEENLFRRTNLFKYLYPYHDVAMDLKMATNANFKNPKYRYPLDGNFGGILAKKVCVFRTSEDKNYTFMEKPFGVDIISVAALRAPKYDKDFKLSDDDVRTEKNKIRTILNIAIENGNDSVILGAFGCGAFKTPPAAMAKCFHEVFEEETYKNKFKEIIFAILNTNSNYEEHNPEGNFKPFEEEFKN